MIDFKSFPIVGEAAFDLLKISGLKGFSCDRREYATHVSMSSVWLFLTDAQVLRITAEMHDLKNWDEVGSVIVEVVSSAEYIPEIIELPRGWSDIASIEKLVVYEDAYFQAESGVRISNSAGEVFIICNAAAPCEITIKAPFFHDKFKPEYDIERYKKFALHNK